MYATFETAVHELDRRVNDGFDVRLLWNSETGQVFVAIDVLADPERLSRLGNMTG